MVTRRLDKAEAVAQTIEAIQVLPHDERILTVSVWRSPTSSGQEDNGWVWSVVVTRTVSNDESREREGIWEDVEEQRLKIAGLLVKQVQDRPFATSYQVYGWQANADAKNSPTN